MPAPPARTPRPAPTSPASSEGARPASPACPQGSAPASRSGSEVSSQVSHSPTRRSLLRAVAALLPLAWARPHWVQAAKDTSGDEAAKRPQRGDALTALEGETRGTPLRVDTLALGAPPLLAVPMDPTTGLIRDGSRLNQVRVLRLPVDSLNAETERYAAEGVVAYSAVCSHTGCPVSEWNAETRRLVCPCHGSEFDPAARAKVENGPAPRRLAVLPLRERDGQIEVRGGFRGKVGFSLG